MELGPIVGCELLENSFGLSAHTLGRMNRTPGEMLQKYKRSKIMKDLTTYFDLEICACSHAHINSKPVAQ